jgi:hypothetical protein
VVREVYRAAGEAGSAAAQPADALGPGAR